MQFLKSISHIFRVWQFSGLAPITFQHVSYEPKPSANLRYFGYFMIVIELLPLILCNIYINFYIDWTLPSIASYMDLLTLNAIRLLSIVIHIEALIKRDTLIIFLRKLQKIDKILLNHLGLSEEYSSFLRQMIFDCVFLALEIAIMFVCLIAYSLIYEDYKYLCYWFMYVLPFVISNIRYMQFVAFVRLIKIRFQLVRQRFNQIIQSERDKMQTKVNAAKDDPFLAKFNTLKKLEKHMVYQEVVLVRRVYHLLWEATILVNKFFHWTMPFAIGNDFCTLVTNFYWLFLWIVHSNFSTMGTLIVSVVWGIVNVRHIMIITNICHRTVVEVKFLWGLLLQTE